MEWNQVKGFAVKLFKSMEKLCVEYVTINQGP
jgi:hypothetical protein